MSSLQEEKIQSSTMLEMLNSSSLPLAKKLSLVQLLCTVERYSKLCNYDVVMKWFADTLQTLPSQKAVSVYKCLAMCLKSDMIFTDNRKLFFKTLLPCFMLPNIPEDIHLSSAVRDCLVSIFNNTYLQEILKYEIGDLSTCIEVFLVTYSFSGVCPIDVFEVFEVIKSMYMGTLLKSDFVEEFVENMLPHVFTFIGTNDAYIKAIDSCFCVVLFPESESASKYLQAFKNYKTDWTPNNQYEFLVKVLVNTPFICGSPMLSGKFYELFCRHFIRSCASNLNMTFDLFTFICSVIGCKPNFNIELPLKANDYDNGFSLQCLNSVLVSIKGSPQITRAVAMENTMFGDYINSLAELIVTQSSETCAEFYNFVCNVVSLIPSRCEIVFRKALSIAILKHKDYGESVSYAEMLAEVLKVYSKFYNMSKFISHLFEEAVKAMAIAKDVSHLKWQYLLPWSFLSTHLEDTAVLLGMANLCQTLDVINNLLMDCIGKIQNQEFQKETETCILVLQFEVLGKIWCILFRNCEIGCLSHQSRNVDLFDRVFTNVKKLLAFTGKLLLSVNFNSKLINIFLEMSKLWGHMNYISERVSTAHPVDTDLRDLSLLYDFLDAQEWAMIGEIIGVTENKICQTKLSDLLLTNLHCIPVTSSRAKKHLIEHIINTVSIEWLWVNNRHLLEHARRKQLANICERLASEESIHIPIRIKLQSAENLCELRYANFFMPVYLMKTAGKLLSADGRNLTASVSSFLTTEFLVAEIKETSVIGGNSRSSLEIAETMISMIENRICESTYLKYEKRTVTYLADAFQILQRMSAHSLEKHLRLLLFVVLVALCKDLTKNKSLQNQTFSFMMDVLVGSCKCSNNMPGLCKECGTYLKLPAESDYSKLLEWLHAESKEYASQTVLIDSMCATIGKDPDLVERTIKSLASNLELICSFYKVLSKNVVLTSDGTVNKRKRRKVTHVSKLDVIVSKCLRYMTDGVVKVVADKSTGLKRSTMVPYAFALRCAIQNDEDNLEILLQHFGSYWKMLKTCFKTSPSFITDDELIFTFILLKNRNVLSSALPGKFIQRVWERLQSSKVSAGRTQLVMLCLSGTELSEYNWIIETLCDEVRMCKLNEVADKALLWSLTVETHVDTKKILILGNGILTACHEFTRLSKLMTNANKPEIAQYKSTVIYFMLTVAKTKQVRVTTAMLDEMFEILNYIRPEEPDGIEMGLRLLITLLNNRDALVHDRIPSFLQRFRFLLTTIAATCQVNEQSDTNVWLPYMKSAYDIERLSQTIVKHDVHFARVAPNIICHLISCFEVYTLPSVIKMHYINSVYLFLSICDKHGREYVQRLMPEPSAEMFKTLYNTYQKYYKYTGKM